MRRLASTFVALVAAASMSGAIVAGASVAHAEDATPSITSDLPDYAPGEDVHLSGAGWGPGEEVHVTVDDREGQSWRYEADRVADAAGDFGVDFTLPNWFVATYDVVATGASGSVATTSFTDSNVVVRAIRPTNVLMAVPIGWVNYNVSNDCTGAVNSSGTATTLTNGQGYAKTSGVGNTHSESLAAPAEVTVGTSIYSFVNWTGDIATTTANPVCIPGDADNGQINVTANYVFDRPVAKTPQTITFDALSDQVYGASDITLTATASSGLPVSYSVGAGDPCSIVSGAVHITGVGTCSVTASQAGNSTYEAATPVMRSFQITPQPVNVTVTGSQVYNGSPSFGHSESLPSGVTLSGSVTCTQLSDGTTITATLSVGSYTLLASSCSGLSLSSANYSVNYVGGSFVVSPAPISVTVSGTSAYGQTPSFSHSETLPSGVTLSGTVTCTTTTTSTAINSTLPVGTYSIDPTTCSGLTSSSSNYSVAYLGGSYVVTKASVPVTVTGSQTYGDASATFTGTPGTLPSGITYTQGSLSCATVDSGTTIGATLGAGSYTVDPGSCTGGSLSGTGSSNYEISYVGGAFTVAKKPITIGASGTQVYGGSPTFTPSYTGTGFVNGDTSSVVTGTLSCTTTDAAPLHVGAHALNACTGLTADNYSISYSLGNLTVTPKPITVAVSGAQVYGGSPTWTPDYTSTAFVSPDTAATVVTGTLSCLPSDTTKAVGSYAITSCSGLSASDYTIGYSFGQLVVSKRPITATITGTQVYGGTGKTFTPSFNAADFVNGDTASVIGGSLTGCTTNATATSPVGSSYTISGCSGLTADNYSISYSYGSFSVTQKPISVTVNGSQVYGGTGVTYTPDYTGVGWVGTDGPSVVTGTLSCSNNATATSGVGSSYQVTSCSGLSATNYAITLVGGTFTVTPATLTVTADDVTRQYSDPSPSPLTATITGFVNGQNLGSSDVTGSPSCTTTRTTESPAGTYPITCTAGSLSSVNYSFTYAPGTFTVTKEDTVIDYTGTTFFTGATTTATSVDAPVAAVLREVADGNLGTKLADQQLLFTATPTGGGSAVSCTADLDASGTGTAAGGCTLLGLNVPETYELQISLVDNSYYRADVENLVVTTSPPGAGFMSGGGWLTEPTLGTRSNLGFTAKSTKKGVSGSSLYIYRKVLTAPEVINGVTVPAGSYNWIIKSNALSTVSMSCDNGTPKVCWGKLTGKSTLKAVNRQTGVTYGLGGNQVFQIDVTDKGEPGSSASTTPDTYGIKVSNSSNGTYYTLGLASNGALIQRALNGGNIQVRP